MRVIKGVLQEELANSLAMKKNYERELAKLPKGSLIKKKVKGTPERPRLVVYRSLNHIYAQVVDDFSGKTLIAASTLTKDISEEISKAKNKCEKSKIVGKWLAEAANKKKISKMIFDRGGYLYHGRIKALAEGVREGGLEF